MLWKLNPEHRLSLTATSILLSDQEGCMPRTWNTNFKQDTAKSSQVFWCDSKDVARLDGWFFIHGLAFSRFNHRILKNEMGNHKMICNIIMVSTTSFNNTYIRHWKKSKQSSFEYQRIYNVSPVDLMTISTLIQILCNIHVQRLWTLSHVFSLKTPCRLCVTLAFMQRSILSDMSLLSLITRHNLSSNAQPKLKF